MTTWKKTAVLAAAALTAVLGGSPAAGAAPAPAKSAEAAAFCGVKSDGKLWCGNKYGAKAYAHRSYSSAVRGELRSTHSWFACWGRGDHHPGGNNVWYWTATDTGGWGNVPAVDVHTPVDPAPGLKEC
ncbi:MULTISPECIES: hypothetical protein [Streptomyces]|uniref:hypothetical protein n=1 Tax=Streptomyces TaxID=1883 RepID=UPI00224920EC|nr:hypothetical protein [Streptomyces sp. JHD 1]MCX2969552.1 hypothetical protein [Streptomyces sp. JHD 1]